MFIRVISGQNFPFVSYLKKLLVQQIPVVTEHNPPLIPVPVLWPQAVPLGHWIFRVGYWIFSSILVPRLPSSGCSPWTLDIPCWILDIRFYPCSPSSGFRLFHLDIGYFPPCGIPRLRDGYWIFSSIPVPCVYCLLSTVYCLLVFCIILTPDS